MIKIQIKSGFTLIELLIVVAIIAILAAVAIPNFLAAQTRSKVSRTQAELKTVATAFEAYYVDYNTYPYYRHPLDQGFLNQWYVPLSVTTPVAYITSLFVDVFPAQNEPEEDHPFHYAHAGQSKNIVRIQYESYYNLPAGTGTNIQWLLFSHGPDIDDDELGSQYDPTNGVNSNGDIARFGP